MYRLFVSASFFIFTLCLAVFTPKVQAQQGCTWTGTTACPGGCYDFNAGDCVPQAICTGYWETHPSCSTPGEGRCRPNGWCYEDPTNPGDDDYYCTCGGGGPPSDPAPTCSSVTAPIVNFNQDTGNFSFDINGVNNASNVRVYIWSWYNEDGVGSEQDDIREIWASNQGGGVWRATSQLQLYPTRQSATHIIGHAYMDGPGGNNVFCGGAVVYKATPPVAQLYFDPDPFGLGIRDLTFNMREDTGQSVNTTAFVGNAGDNYRVASSLIARRACVANNSNCAPYTGPATPPGNWITVPLTYNTCNGTNASCMIATSQTNFTMADFNVSSVWEYVQNAYDVTQNNSNYQCSGNAQDAWTSPYQTPWTKCDRDSNLSYHFDKVRVYLNLFPTARFTSVSIAGVPQALTNSYTVTQGQTMVFGATGDDTTLDNGNTNNMNLLNLYRVGSPSNINMGSFTCPANSATCSYNNFIWNTGGVTPGSYTVFISSSDTVSSCNPGVVSAGATAYEGCDRDALATTFDEITINVSSPTYSVSGDVFNTSAGCTDATDSLGNLSSVSLTAGVNTYSAPPPPIAGVNWTVTGVAGGSNVTTVCANMNPSAGNAYQLTCVRSPTSTNYSTSPSAGCIQLALNSMLVNSNLAGWRLGFAVSNAPAWITMADGDAYAPGGVTMRIPSSPAGNFKRFFLIDTPYDTGGNSGFVQSNNGIDVNTTSAIYEAPGGYFDIGGAAYNLSLWPSNYIQSIPSTCTANTITAANLATMTNLNASNCYYMNSATFNSWASGAGTANYNITSPATNSVTVVYVGDASGNAPLTISRQILSSTPADNERLLFVSLQNVTIASTLGVAAPNLATIDTAASIQGGIVTSAGRNITFASANPTADTTIYLDGIALANGVVNFDRDRLTTNAYPATVLRYMNLYLSNLTSRERASATANYTGLFVNNVTWSGN